MDMLAAYFGLGLILAGTGILLTARLGLRVVNSFLLRPIRSLSSLRNMFSSAVEEGRRSVVYSGNAAISGPRAAASLTALTAARIGLRESLHADRAGWIASSEGTTHMLALDMADDMGRDAAPRCLLPGISPLPAVAGLLLEIREARSGANLILGDFGAEAALIAEACQDLAARVEGTSAALDGQAVLFAGTDHPLTGGEYYAVPAYLGDDNQQRAGLLAQDVLRWLLIAALLAAPLLILLGVIPR